VKKEAASTSEKPVSIYDPIRYYNPDVYLVISYLVSKVTDSLQDRQSSVLVMLVRRSFYLISGLMDVQF